MIDDWALWALLVGLAVGAAGATLLFMRLPRQDDDLGEAERRIEAAWISSTIERYGGVAPESLVEEVLDLHRAYLAMPRPPAPAGASAPPIPDSPLPSSPPPTTMAVRPPSEATPPPSYPAPPPRQAPPAPPPAPPGPPAKG